MHKLIEYVCEELESLEKKAAKGSMSAAEIEYADKLASLKKNLLKGDMLYEEAGMDGEYSGNMGGMSYQRGDRGGNRGGTYVDGMSYARGDGRGRGRNARRDSMGRYSRDGGYDREDGYSRDAEDMVAKLREVAEDAPDEESRKEIHKLIRKMEQM